MSDVLQKMLSEMTPEIYQRLSYAVETGKWPDGVALTAAQREHALQLVLLWQAQHNCQPQHMSLAQGGEMVIKSKRELKQEFGISDEITKIYLN